MRDRKSSKRLAAVAILTLVMAACSTEDFWRVVYKTGKNACEQADNCDSRSQ